jgi:hypothetical protein
MIAIRQEKGGPKSDQLKFLLDARINMIPQDGIDLFIPSPSAKHAVMANVRLEVVRLHIRSQARA